MFNEIYSKFNFKNFDVSVYTIQCQCKTRCIVLHYFLINPCTCTLASKVYKSNMPMLIFCCSSRSRVKGNLELYLCYVSSGEDEENQEAEADTSGAQNSTDPTVRSHLCLLLMELMLFLLQFAFRFRILKRKECYRYLF